MWRTNGFDSHESSSHSFACTKQRGPSCETPIRSHLDCHCRCLIRSWSHVVLCHFERKCTSGQPATLQGISLTVSDLFYGSTGSTVLHAVVAQLGNKVAPASLLRVSQAKRFPFSTCSATSFKLGAILFSVPISSRRLIQAEMATWHVHCTTHPGTNSSESHNIAREEHDAGLKQ